MKLFFIITFTLLPIGIYAQVINLSGSVFDKETQIPIPLTNIFTQDNRVGTISTTEGEFSINISDNSANNYLYFSSLGYEIDSILIQRYPTPLLIQLKPKVYALKEVYVMPDSTLLTLLRKAYHKIPENYPTQCTRYEVFFQETTSMNDSLAKIVEATLSVYKESYQKKWAVPGQVEIVNSRIKQFQDIRTGFSGGAFSLITGDGVLQRASFIDPKTMNQFQYQFNGVVMFNGRYCYEIEVRSRNITETKDMEAKMLIDKETLAYVSFEIKRLNNNIAPFRVNNQPTEFLGNVVYEQHNGLWYLTRCSGRAKHESARLPFPLFSSVDMVVTHIRTSSVKPIPVSKRLERTELIESKVETYNPKGWTDSDVLANINTGQLGFQFPLDESASIFQQNAPKNFSSTNKKFSFVSKFIIGFGVTYTPISFNELSQNMRFQPNQDLSPFTLTTHLSNTQANFHIQYILGYRISKKWQLFWQNTSNSLFSKDISHNTNSLGIKFLQNINNAGYPLFFGTSILVSDRNYYRDLGTYDSPNSFTYDNKKFNANKLDFSYGIREQTIMPQISLSKRVSKLITVTIHAGYHFSIHSEENIKFEEKGGFALFRKKAYVKFNDTNLVIDEPNVLKHSFSTNRMEIGIVLSFP